MKKKLTCFDAKVQEDTFICKEIIWHSDKFIVSSGTYGERDMIAMRWYINPEHDVKNDKTLQEKGFPLNINGEPVWLTVPFELVESLKDFFKQQDITKST